MNDEHTRYAALVAADIDSLSQLVENRRALVKAEQLELEADERRLAELVALLKHVRGAE